MYFARKAAIVTHRCWRMHRPNGPLPLLQHCEERPSSRNPEKLSVTFYSSR